MTESSLRLKWVHSGCQLSPDFLSSDKMCFPCDNFIRICDIDANGHRSFPVPGKGISCLTTIPDLAVIGVAEKCQRPKIFVIRYPSFRVVSVICYGSKSEYVALTFAGMDYLVSVCGKPDNDITLWNWRTGQRLHSTLQSCCYLTDCTYRLTSNPSSWFQLCLEQTRSLTVLEIKNSGQQMAIHQRCLVSPEEENKNFFIHDESHASIMPPADRYGKKKRIAIISHCWIPDGNVIAACEDGTIMIVDIIDFNIKILHCFQPNVLTSLAYNGSGLFVGKRDGYLLWVDISEQKWKLLEHLNIGQTIVDLKFCPNYERLAIISSQGSVFTYKTGEENVRCVVSGDKTAVVGICIIHPQSRYSITARSNGLIQAWCMTTGRFISKAHIDDDVVSLSGSPLCPLVILATATGYLYFLDATNIINIRTVHVMKPYDISVGHVRFDNFGRYVVLASGKEILFILNGLPSYGFQCLGCRQPLGYIRDLAVFTRSEETVTDVILLSQSDSCHREGVADMIEMLEIPTDLQNDPKKYQSDVFGTLLSDDLNACKWSLEIPASKIGIHSDLGAIVYSPLSNQIYAFNMWVKKPRITVLPMCVQKANPEYKICDLILSSDHRYLICISQYSTVCIFNLLYAEDSPTTSETFGNGESDYKIAFSESVSSVVIGSGKGIVACYEFNDLPLVETTMPEWLLKCIELSGVEILALSEMEEEGTLTLKRKRTRKAAEKTLNESPDIKEELVRKLKDISVSLDYVARKTVCDLDNAAISSHDFHLHDDDLLKISQGNKKRLEHLINEDRAQKAKVLQSNELLKLVEKQTLCGIKTTLEISNYAGIERSVEYQGRLNGLQESKQNFESTEKFKQQPVWANSRSSNEEKTIEDMLQGLKLIYVSSSGFLFKPLELSNQRQKFNEITLLNELIITLQEEFNKEFGIASEFKRKGVRLLREAVFRLKELASQLGVSEPFWQIETGKGELEILEERGVLQEQKNEEQEIRPHALLCETELEIPPKEPSFMTQKPLSLWDENEKRIAKRYEIRCQEVSQSNMEREFAYLKHRIGESITEVDEMCGSINELKTICNFMIYEIEIKIFVLLLWLMMENELMLWKQYYETEISSLKGCRKPIKVAIEKVSALKKAAKEFYNVLVKLERSMDFEAQRQCQQFKSHSEELYKCFQRRPALSIILKTRGRNPYRPCSPRPLSREDLQSCLETLNSESNCPVGVDRETWNIVCDSRVWKFAAEEVLRSQTLHLLGIYKILLQWKTQEQEMKNEDKAVSAVLGKLRSLMVKCDDTAGALLYDRTRNSEMDFLLLTEHSTQEETQEVQDLTIAPMTIWRAIHRGTYKDKRLQNILQAIENRFLDLRNFRESIKSKGKVTGAKEYERKVKKLNVEMKHLEDNFNKNQELMTKVQQSLLKRES